MNYTYRIDNGLALRMLEPRHAEELFTVIDANRQVILPWMRWVYEVTEPTVVKEHLIGWVKQTAETGCMSLGIELEGVLVGVVFHVRPDTVNKQVEVGYWLAESARGKGIATRAVRAFIDVTIRELGFNRVIIRIAPGNKASLAVAERLGLKPEGVSRQAWKAGDEYWDATEFGVLACEWEPKAPSFALTHRIDEELVLRLPELRHSEDLFRVINDNREHIARWLSWCGPGYALADAELFIKQNLISLAEGNGCTSTLIFHDRLVGGIGNQPVNHQNCSADIGYWLAESAQGQGIVTRAARAVVDDSLIDMDLNRVTIHAAVENAKSWAVPERLGFERVGVMRKSVPLRGEYIDMIQYAMLAEEWKGGSI